MSTFWHVLVGLLTTFILGLGVDPLLKHLQKSAALTPPNETLRDKWATLTQGNEGGKILGYLERLLFFGAFWIDAPVVIASWLAFKVASNWNAWSNVISVPTKISGIDELDYLVARRRWGSQLLMTFLIGTLSNVVTGFLGAVIGRW